MTPQQKKRIVLYGVLLSTIHFAVVGLCHAIPMLFMRSEDMSAPPDGKPTWPSYRLGEAVVRVGNILRIPFDWIWEGRLNHFAPDAVGILLMILTSCLWGFGMVLVFRFVFTHVRPRHANAA